MPKSHISHPANGEIYIMAVRFTNMPGHVVLMDNPSDHRRYVEHDRLRSGGDIWSQSRYRKCKHYSGSRVNFRRVNFGLYRLNATQPPSYTLIDLSHDSILTSRQKIAKLLSIHCLLSLNLNCLWVHLYSESNTFIWLKCQIHYTSGREHYLNIYLPQFQRW